VHRDIKLENVMLREKGSLNKGIVIIDFGLAGNLQKMKEYHLEGTIKYAPPELMSGSNLHADPAFDVWTLGVLLYRLVSGIYPFEGQNYGEIKKSILTHTPTFPQEHFEFISDSCLALIKLMLYKDSMKRPRI
jgi:serine/threonine protein kinase